MIQHFKHRYLLHKASAFQQKGFFSIILLSLVLIFSKITLAQTADIHPPLVSLEIEKDSVNKARISEFLFLPDLKKSSSVSPKVKMPAEPRKNRDKRFDFLYLIGLFLFAGLIKLYHPQYFNHLISAFRNPILSNRQLKDQLRQDYLPGLLLDVLFYLSSAFFIYSCLVFFNDNYWQPSVSKVLIIFGMAIAISIIYIFRQLFLRFLEWLLSLEGVFDNYSFNISLFNKILGIGLIPFSFILCFGDGKWVGVFFILALLILFSVYILRFIRSRQIIVRFIGFSKFNFMLYLCAVEIIPTAVLIKAAISFYY